MNIGNILFFAVLFTLQVYMIGRLTFALEDVSSILKEINKKIPNINRERF